MSFPEIPPNTSPYVLFLMIVVGTFISEDATLLGSGALWLRGELDYSLAFWANFVGIFVGDVAIYLLARVLGRRAMAYPFVGRLIHEKNIARGEVFYRRWGVGLLLVVRFLPGTRVAAYVGAGLFRCSFPVFTLAVGGTGLIWVGGCLGLLERAGGGGYARLWGLGALVTLVVARWAITVSRPFGWRVRALRWARWRYFEFWPASVFYIPVVFYYAWLSLKYRSPLLPSAANPAIETGGLIGESKNAILKLLDPRSPYLLKYREFAPGPDVLSEIREYLKTERLEFPVILKPDAGQRGSGVQRVDNWAMVEAYVRDLGFSVLVQEYCGFEGEVGVFYYRFPNTNSGELFSITRKHFPQVVGDGSSTLAELIIRDARARWMAGTFFERHREILENVLAPGERFRLVEAGNHCQGTVFYDGRELGTPELARALDAICAPMGEFYVGRFDLRFSSENALKRGEGFKIIEINGAGAEATHIYDPENSLWAAYRVLAAQWRLIFSIGDANRKRGFAIVSPLGFLKSWWSYGALKKKHPFTT